MRTVADALRLILRCEPEASLEGWAAGRQHVTLHLMLGWVYILRCSDGSYYVGSHRSDDVGDRVRQHQVGDGGAYTARRLPVELVFAEWFERIEDAVASERQIKGWSRAKKEALIRGDLALLREKAKRRGGKPRG